MGVANYLTVDGEILSETRSGVERDYLPDSLGSTIALIDSSQNLTDRFAYWPYGEEQSRSGTNATPFQFVGTAGYHQDSSSVAYVRARWLQVMLGRWVTVDSRWPWESAFAYADGSPASNIDPAGMGCQDSMLKVAGSKSLHCADEMGRAWGNTNPIHICNHQYSHCMTCCVLAVLYGVDAAWEAQEIQLGLRLPPDLVTEENAFMRMAERALGCAMGLDASNGASHSTGDVMSACSNRCVKTFPPPDAACKRNMRRHPYTLPIGCVP